MDIEKVNELLTKFGLNMKIEGQKVYFIDTDNNTKMVTYYKPRHDSAEQISTSDVKELFSAYSLYVTGEKKFYRLNMNYDEQNNLFRINELVKYDREFVEDSNGVYINRYGESDKKYKKITHATTLLDFLYNNEEQLRRLCLNIYENEKEAGLVIAQNKLETQVYYIDDYSVVNDQFLQNKFDMYIKKGTNDTYLEDGTSIDFEYACKKNPLIYDTMSIVTPEILKLCIEKKLDNDQIMNPIKR